MRRILIDTLLFALIGAILFFAVAGQVRAQSGDPSGFTDSLNLARQSRGLSAVFYDPGAAACAYENNKHQFLRGLGHFVTGGYAQCVAVGQADPGAAAYAWFSSAGHAAILFDPNLISVGYHQLGSVHTVSCYGGSPNQNFSVTQRYVYKQRVNLFGRFRASRCQ